MGRDRDRQINRLTQGGRDRQTETGAHRERRGGRRQTEKERERESQDISRESKNTCKFKENVYWFGLLSLTARVRCMLCARAL